MTSVQKVIKYFAIALAAAIIIGMITFSITLLRGIYIIAGGNGASTLVDMHTLEVSNSDNLQISDLDIEISCTNLTIKQGDELKIETNDGNIISEQNDQKLIIKEKEKKHYNTNKDNLSVIIYVPASISFEKVDMEIGAGKVDIDGLNVKKINFNLGAGKSDIKNINILESAKISTGAGKTDISSGNIKDLKLDIGAGSIKVSSKILGDSKINAGVGNLEININGKKEEY